MTFFTFQSLLQDISSHQRIVDSVVEKAQSVLQSSSNPDVANFITEVNSRYEALAQAAKVGGNTVELQWLKHLRDHEIMFDTGGVRAYEC